MYYAPRVVSIEVQGEHEYGLDRHDDIGDCYRWLLKRFCKETEERDIRHIDYEEDGSSAIYHFILEGQLM